MQNVDFESLPPFPDMTGWDEETYRAYVIWGVEKGLEDVRAGRVHSHKEVGEMLFGKNYRVVDDGESTDSRYQRVYRS